MLVVEDRPQVRRYVSDVLRSYGYQVIETANADEALKRSQSAVTNIDLVLTDVMMPGINGVDLVARLTKQRPDIKALLMSGYTNSTIPQGESDALAFLHKPFSPKELAEKLRSILAG